MSSNPLPKRRRPAWLDRFPTITLPPISSSMAPFIIGLVLLSAGAWWAWPPAGLIAPGLVLIYVALAGDNEVSK